MATCAACGEESPSRARFCWSCGAELAAAPAEDERRIVTVLFVDLVGSTAWGEGRDPEDVLRVLDAYHESARAELERFGGTVAKFIGDGVMGLFGAQVAHEDDPERAVRAALAIRAAVTALFATLPDAELHLRIGVHTGEAAVTTRTVGTGTTADVAGDVVNTCARIESAAPADAILVGEATYRATSGAIEYRAAPPVLAKGKAEPVPVWEAVAPLAADARRPRPTGPLVGRAEELAALREVVESAHDRRSPRLAFLVGEAGIGKSRLVEELTCALEAPAGVAACRRGRCLPYGDGVGFRAFAEIVRAEAGIVDADDAETAARKLGESVRAALPDEAEASWVERHLRPLVGAATAGGGRQSESFAAWRRFVQRVAERRPLLLVFEDVHLAGDDFLELVDELVDATSSGPYAVLCTARPELLERHPGLGAPAVALAPLSDAETDELLASLLDHAELPAAVRRAVVAAAEGNPLYAEEYVRMLADRGLLEAGLAPGDEEALPLPESVQGIVAARLDALEREERALLLDAAVVGRTFWPGCLAALGGTARTRVDELLAGLERRDFVRREARSAVHGEPAWSFDHQLVREVAYAQILRARRAQRHHATALWLESVAPEHTALLAHHDVAALEYARAARQETEELVARARASSVRAGDRALAVPAFAAANRHFARALELCPADDPSRPRLLLRTGQAAFWAEGAGAELLAEARDELAAAGEREAAADAEVMLARLALSAGERDRAVADAQSAVARMREAGPSRAKAAALATLAFLLLGDDPRAARDVVADALRMAEELGLDDLRAHALNTLGLARATLGDAGGVADLERSVALAEELGSPESVRGHVNLGSLLANLGRLPEAFAQYARGAAAAERFGDARGLSWFAGERLSECWWTGRADEAEALADDVVAQVEAGAPQYIELDSRRVRAWVRLERRDLQGALEDSERGLELARRAADPHALYAALACRARVLAAAGALDAADSLCTELLEEWERGGLRDGSFWTADLADVLSTLRRGGELLGRAGRAQPRTRWLDAAAAVAAGDHARAAEVYAEIGSTPDEARCRRRAASEMTAV